MGQSKPLRKAGSGALGALWSPRHFVWQAWHWQHPPSLCVAGVALGDIHLRFAWQAWHLWQWAGSGGALGAPWSPSTPWQLACIRREGGHTIQEWSRWGSRSGTMGFKTLDKADTIQEDVEESQEGFNGSQEGVQGRRGTLGVKTLEKADTPS